VRVIVAIVAFRATDGDAPALGGRTPRSLREQWVRPVNSSAFLGSGSQCAGRRARAAAIRFFRHASHPPMHSTSSISLSGMNAAQTRLQGCAFNIANLGTATFRRQQVASSTAASGGVSAASRQAPQPGNAIEADLVETLEAKHAFLANLAVFKTGDRMTGSLLDAMG
jgi:hypothetical protein